MVNAIMGEGALILKLFFSEDKSWGGGRKACPLMYPGLDLMDVVRVLNTQTHRPIEGPTKDLNLFGQKILGGLNIFYGGSKKKTPQPCGGR